jgi:hypothetical protein
MNVEGKEGRKKKKKKKKLENNFPPTTLPCIFMNMLQNNSRERT